MRVLLDECLPRTLKRLRPGHEARTTPEMGWAGKRDGDLLRLAERDFDVFLTVDRKLQHQQSLSTFDIAVVALVAPGNTLADLQPLIAAVLEHLPNAKRRQALVVQPSSRNVRLRSLDETVLSPSWKWIVRQMGHRYLLSGKTIPAESRSALKLLTESKTCRRSNWTRILSGLDVRKSTPAPPCSAKSLTSQTPQ